MVSNEQERILIELVQEVRTCQGEIVERFTKHERHLSATLKEHAQASINWRAEILKAFPDGDTNAHREYHQSIVEWRKLRNKIALECLINASKAGFLAGSCWLLYAVLTAIKMELTQK